MANDQIKIGDVMFRKSAAGEIKCTLSSTVGSTIPNILFDEVVRLREYLSHIESKSKDPFVFVQYEQVPIYLKRKKDGMWVAFTTMEPFFCIEGADKNSVMEEAQDVMASYQRRFNDRGLIVP